MKYNAEIIGETGLNEANFNCYFQKKMDKFLKLKRFESQAIFVFENCK